MGSNQSKGRIEVDIKRQAWVRSRRPNPSHPKHRGLTRPQTSRAQQRYDAPASYYQQGPEASIDGGGDESRSHHGESGLRRAQSTRSQGRRDQTFYSDDSDDEAGEEMPFHGSRHEGPSHHGSRGLSGRQSGGRGMSHAQSNSRFAPPSAEHMRTSYAASGSHRGSQPRSQR